MPAQNKTILNNVVFAIGTRRLSQDSNQVDLQLGRADVDFSTFEDLADRHGKGSEQNSITVNGFASTEADSWFINRLAAGDECLPGIFFLRQGAAVGTVAAILESDLFQLSKSPSRNAANPFTLNFMGQSRISIGFALHNTVNTGAIESTSNGAGVEVGALAANNEMMIALIAPDPPGVSGTTPSMTVAIETDVDNTFSAPTTRATFTALTDVGYQVITIDGDSTPITDTWARATFTVSGTSPSFPALIALAIRPK